MKHNVLITGVSGYLGQALVQRLMRDNPFGAVYGVDLRPPRLLGPVQFLHADVARVDLGDLLVMNAIDTVLHVHFADQAQRSEALVARRLLEAAGIVGLRRLVIASRDAAYARTREDAARPRTEADAIWPPAATRPFKGAIKARVEHLVESAAEQMPEVEVVTIRGCHVIGPRRGSTIDGYLQLPWLPGPLGWDPCVHFLHEDDAAEIYLRAALLDGVRGPINAAGAEPLHLSEVAGVLQKPVLRLPEWLSFMAVRGFRVLRTARVPVIDPTHLQGSLPLDTQRLQTVLGYTPRYSTRQTLAVWRTGYRGP